MIVLAIVFPPFHERASYKNNPLKCLGTLVCGRYDDCFLLLSIVGAASVEETRNIIPKDYQRDLFDLTTILLLVFAVEIDTSLQPSCVSTIRTIHSLEEYMSLANNAIVYG